MCLHTNVVVVVGRCEVTLPLWQARLTYCLAYIQTDVQEVRGYSLFVILFR